MWFWIVSKGTAGCFNFWLRWVFVAERGLSLVEASEGYSVVVHGLLIAVASLIAEHDL